MNKYLLIVLVVLFTGCSTFKLGNALETTALGAVSYATGGAIPAVAVVSTSVIANELNENETLPTDIQTTEQLIAYAIDDTLMYGLYGFIAFLIITNIIIPYFNQRRILRRMEYDRKNKDS